MSKLSVTVAARCLSAGGVIAYPTEAVWGLGCDPFSQTACLSLLQIKHRPVEKGMILVAASMKQLEFLLAPLSQQQQNTLMQAWRNPTETGPVTYLVGDPLAQVPWWVKGKHLSVAVRVSGHPGVKALCEKFGGPVVSTSANRAGMAPIRSRVLLEKQLAAELDFVLPGALGGAQQPSRIIDLATGQVMRAA